MSIILWSNNVSFLFEVSRYPILYILFLSLFFFFWHFESFGSEVDVLLLFLSSFFLFGVCMRVLARLL